MWGIDDQFSQTLGHIVERQIDGTQGISKLSQLGCQSMEDTQRRALAKVDAHLVRDHVDKVFLSLLKMFCICGTLQQEPLPGLSLGAGLQCLKAFRFRLDGGESGAKGITHGIYIFGCGARCFRCTSKWTVMVRRNSLYA